MSSPDTDPSHRIGPLRGVRVLDIATLFAAPALAAILGDLGADVVKVEPPAGDPQRLVGTMVDGQSIVWALVSRNKRSVTLDHKTESGRALLARMVEKADVIVANQPADVLQRWGCSYEDVAERNPRAVMVIMSIFGTTGPYGGRPGNGSIAEAFGGFSHMTGEPDGPPVLPSAALGDSLAALSGAMGVVSALYWRDANGGTGQLIDLAMYEPVIALQATAMVAWHPGETPPNRTGSRYPGGAPRNVYRSSDDVWVVLAAPTDAQALRVLEVMGEDTARNRARFGTSANRLAHADEIDALVASWISRHDVDAVLDAFSAARVPVIRVNDLATLVADPHVAHRNSVVVVDDPIVGPLYMPSPTPTFSESPTEIAWAGPPLGEHSAAVYRDWLDIDVEELAQLRADGAL